MTDKRVYKVYLGSGWFSPRTKEILDYMELTMDHMPEIKLYSPRRDGKKLNEGQKNDKNVLLEVFRDNISNIDNSDYVVANIYSGDPFNDTGTMYEIGYAMSKGIPVIGYSPDMINISERFKGIVNSFAYMIIGEGVLESELLYFIKSQEELYSLYKQRLPDNVLYVGYNQSIVSHLKPLGNVSLVIDYPILANDVDSIFKKVDYMFVCIDDHPVYVSWMMGQAHERGIPVITYSDHDYGINIMLLASILTHVRGTKELDKLVKQIMKGSIESVSPIDISQVNSF